MQQRFLTALGILAGSLIGASIAIMVMNKPKNYCEYQMIVTDDSVTVYDFDRTVGTIKLEGQLDSLITFDNQ